MIMIMIMITIMIMMIIIIIIIIIMRSLGKKEPYQQLAFEIRERRPGYTVEVILFAIGCLGGGMKKLEETIVRKII